MKELSLHILDLVENSLKAEASLVNLTVIEDTEEDLLTIEIEDNGKGMDKEFLENVDDPFTTTRTTRSVGLGISLTKAAALRCEGDFNITSEKGVGTKITFVFKHSHIDRAPIGNMGDTISSIVNQCEETELVYTHIYNGEKFVMDTREIKELLDGVDIRSTEIILWIIDYINDNIKNLYTHKKL